MLHDGQPVCVAMDEGTSWTGLVDVLTPLDEEYYVTCRSCTTSGQKCASVSPNGSGLRRTSDMDFCSSMLQAGSVCFDERACLSSQIVWEGHIGYRRFQ